MKTYWLMIILVAISLFPFPGRAQVAPDWTCNVYDYQYDMSVYLNLKQNNVSVNENKTVAAFCQDECRGIAELQAVEGTSFYYLRVRSRLESGDTISFRVYDKEKSQVILISEKLVFENLKQTGYPSQPWLATLPTVVSTDDLGEITSATEEIQLSGELTQEVVDALKDKIQGEGGTNDKLSSVDLSNVTINENTTSLGGLFSGCGFLTSVTLPSLSTLRSEQNPFAGANPNCVVVASPATEIWPEMRQNINIVQNGIAEQLKLQSGYPFSSPISFVAKKAVYSHIFIPATKKLKAAVMNGWETICLPFSVTEFKAGDRAIVPTTYQQNADFYMALLTQKGFELSDKLQANTPYIIRMINPAGNAVEGKIDFLAENVTIIVSSQEYISEGLTYNLVGTTTGVTGSDAVYKLNEEGNTFIRQGGDIEAFRGYIRPKSSTLGSTVSVKLYIPVKGIAVSAETLSLKEGESKELTATLSPEDATDKTVTWESDDNSIATVSTTGKVTGIKAGTTTVIVKTNDGNYSAVCSVSVTKPSEPIDPEPTVKVTGVVLDQSSRLLNIGEKMTLTATVLPSNATNKKIYWKSSDISVATVDEAGRVTALKAGNTVVSVTTEDGNLKADCRITVSLPTGIEEIKEARPCVNQTIDSDYITVTGLKKSGKIWVISFSGHIIKEIETAASSVSIPVQNLSSGFYLIKILQGKKQYTYKICRK